MGNTEEYAGHRVTVYDAKFWIPFLRIVTDVPETGSQFTTVSSGNSGGCAGDRVTVYDGKFWEQ